MRVALTQGVVDYDEGQLDCIDHAWTRLLESWGHLPIPVPGALTRPEDMLAAIRPGTLIVTGGPVVDEAPDVHDVRPEQEETERRLISWCEVRRVPVIGVCRGMELLLSLHGGQLRSIAGHISHRHLVSVQETPFTSGGGFREVNSFHHHAVEAQEVRLPLVPFAWDADGNVEAFYRTVAKGTLSEVGIMWHPERDGVAEWASLTLNSVLRYIEAQNRSKESSSR